MNDVGGMGMTCLFPLLILFPMKNSILLLLLSFPLIISAQDKHDHIWLFGYTSDNHRAMLDFNGSQMEISDLEFEMDVAPTNTIMSDEDGNLLFYSNGCDINNANHEIMENGEVINPGMMEDIFCPSQAINWPQGVLALPLPESDSLYYVFNLNLEGVYPSPPFLGIAPRLLYAQLIDMSENNGLGKVIEKNQVIKQDTFGRGGIQATRHANGIDWWMTVPKSHSNCYWVFLINKEGMEEPFLECEGEVWLDRDQLGQQSFSPNGEWFARIHSSNYFQLYKFNNVNGSFSDAILIDLPDLEGTRPGVSFSPNSQYLYANTREKVYQLDLMADDIPNSRVLIAEYDGYWNISHTTFDIQALAPNGKIYISVPGSTYNLHVIHKPDCPGLKSELQQHGIELPVFNGSAVPHFPHYRNLPSSVDCDSVYVSLSEEVLNRFIKIFPNPTQGVNLFGTKGTGWKLCY